MSEIDRQIPNSDARRIREAAYYLLAAEDISYDSATGLMELRIFTETPSSPEVFTQNREKYLEEEEIIGTPGDVIADKRFPVPYLRGDIGRLDLAFELGVLLNEQSQGETQRG